MSIEKLQLPATLDQERIDAIKTLLPEAVADGRINFDTLRDLLAEVIEDDDQDAEHFGLAWPGKREARRLAALPSKGTLAPVPGEGVDEENTENIFIEGENLEVLKILKKSYAGKIKMIYIDPPYNTGNDFIYKDNYSEPLESYLRRTGQADEEGKLLVSNTKTDGRFHSNWLTMMYPRLKLMQGFLAEDGFICVSIDDNEVYTLGLLMDEMFGSSMRIACAPWLAEPSGGKEKTGLRSGHEYMLIYGNIERITQEERSTGELNLKDQWGNYRKGRELRKWGGTSLRKDRPNQWYELTAPDGTKVCPIRNDGKEGHWRWGKNQKMKEIIEDPEKAHWEKCPYDNGVIVNEETERWVPFEKIRDTSKSVGWSTWLDSHGFNADGTRELKELFGNKVLDTPKPTKLIQWLISLHDDDDALILDSFAGSGSTAHAVMGLNQQDGGRRKFICIQLPEKAQQGDFITIADIAKERIRRSIKKLNESENGQLGFDNSKQDRGFRAFKLTPSNFRCWQDQEEENVGGLILQAEQKALTPLIDGAKEAGVLTEIALLEGFALSAKQTRAEEFTRNKVTCITDGFNAHRLYVCLDRELWEETVDQVERLPKESVFYCFDNALSDAAKIQLAECCRVVTI